MARKIAIVFSWFLLTPLALIFAIFLVNQRQQISYLSQVGPTLATQTQNDHHLDGQVLGVEISDMRPYYVANFLEGTRLEPYAHLIIETSDKYAIDYRLIPAIAMRESTGGNAVDEASHNAWGWENGRTYFDSWEQAIEIVAKTLKYQYIDKGLVTPEQIMAVYAPPQIEKDGKWARDINYFFSKLQSL